MIVSHVPDVDAAERAIAIGSFDGVHAGHRRVIGRAKEAAREHGIRSAVVTFRPHPMTVLRPERAPRELTSPGRQEELLRELAPDELALIRFTHEFSQLSHEQFAEDVLAGVLRARHVIVGENFRYGNRAQGTIETLRASGQRLGFEVEPAPLLQIGGAPVSSSRIRDLLAGGQVEQAAALLGRDPSIEGKVVHGDGRGRELGFATANLEPAPHSALPATGVYAGRAHVEGGSWPAAISVGFNPTFSDDRRRVRIEAHLLDFDRDVYGEPIRIELARRLRDEERYDSIDELVDQVHRDIDAVRSMGT
jgi:riboflavin kinase / FMN adenylyltransferase